MKVENMLSTNARTVPNQFIITDDKGTYFQSYKTIIVFKPAPKTQGSGTFQYDAHNPIQLDRDKWDYSVTTGKYRNIFLGEKKSETDRKIKSGEYILTDLN